MLKKQGTAEDKSVNVHINRVTLYQLCPVNPVFLDGKNKVIRPDNVNLSGRNKRVFNSFNY